MLVVANPSGLAAIPVVVGVKVPVRETFILEDCDAIAEDDVEEIAVASALAEAAPEDQAEAVWCALWLPSAAVAEATTSAPAVKEQTTRAPTPVVLSPCTGMGAGAHVAVGAGGAAESC